MRARNFLIVGVIAVLVIAGVVGYAFLRPPETASGPIEAIPLEEGSASETTAAAEPTSNSAATSAPATAQPATADATSAATEATNAPEAAAAAETAASQTSETINAEIVPEESEARFVINEVLNNAPFTVIGTTNQVAGELAVNPTDPSQTRVGIIQVNVRTLATDSEFRDRAIKNRILTTDEYEFVTFAPTELLGLPDTAAIGQSYTFQIVGDLTIRDVTKQVTFDVTATPVSETRLEGLAQTTINYPDYNLQIPEVPQVASVEDSVRLEIEFVAVPRA